MIFTDSVGHQGIVVHLLRGGGPAEEPALVPRRHGIRVLGAEIARRVERTVGNRHLRGVPAAGHGAVDLHGIRHSDAGASGVGASAGRGGSEDDR